MEMVFEHCTAHKFRFFLFFLFFLFTFTHPHSHPHPHLFDTPSISPTFFLLDFQPCIHIARITCLLTTTLRHPRLISSPNPSYTFDKHIFLTDPVPNSTNQRQTTKRLSAFTVHTNCAFAFSFLLSFVVPGQKQHHPSPLKKKKIKQSIKEEQKR